MFAWIYCLIYTFLNTLPISLFNWFTDKIDEHIVWLVFDHKSNLILSLVMQYLLIKDIVKYLNDCLLPLCTQYYLIGFLSITYTQECAQEYVSCIESSNQVRNGSSPCFEGGGALKSINNCCQNNLEFIIGFMSPICKCSFRKRVNN